MSSNTLLTRGWKYCGADEGGSNAAFTVMTWNHLADGLAQDGGFFVEDPEVLTWEFRQDMILQEIRK